MRVAVTGATGVVGRFIVAELLSNNHEVTALARPTSDLAGFTQAPRWVTGLLPDQEALRGLLEQTDALVHCALAHEAGRYRGGEGTDPLSFWQTNLLGTVSLLETASRHGVDRVVLMSSRAVFGRRRDGEDKVRDPVSDDHPLWPTSHYGALKAATESLASTYTEQGLCCTALRPTGVYGLGHPVSSSKWFELALQARSSGVPPTERIATEVHGRDVARAVELLLTAPVDAVAGRGFNCSDVIVSRQAVFAHLCDRLADKEVPTSPTIEPVRAALENRMRCDGLQALGWRPGGRALLEETLAALLDAAAS